MEYFSIEIDGNHFKKNYLIYVIAIKKSDDINYFYIGQTGDRNYITARPAFRRLGGHLSDQGHSTENQVYRAIATSILKLEPKNKQTFSPEIKHEVSKFLISSKITMHVFPIRDFPDDISKEEHNFNMLFIEQIERGVINTFILKYGREKILNKKILPLKDLNNKDVNKWVIEVMNKF